MRASVHAVVLAALSFADRPSADTYRELLRTLAAFNVATLRASDARAPRIITDAALAEPSAPIVRHAPACSLDWQTEPTLAGLESPAHAQHVTLESAAAAYARRELAVFALQQSVDALERVDIRMVPHAHETAKRALAREVATLPTLRIVKPMRVRGSRGGKQVRAASMPATEPAPRPSMGRPVLSIKRNA